MERLGKQGRLRPGQARQAVWPLLPGALCCDFQVRWLGNLSSEKCWVMASGTGPALPVSCLLVVVVVVVVKKDSENFHI